MATGEKKQPTREEMRRKRCVIEARRVRECGDHVPRDGRPDENLPTRLLRLTGLFARGSRNANSPVLRKVAFAFESLPAAFDGFQVLHLSDLHFDSRPGYAEAVFNLIENVEADLCVMTGDYRFGFCTPWRAVHPYMERLRSIIRARHGAVAVLGNNDTWDFIEPFQKIGIRALVNENIPIEVKGESIWLAGVDDPNAFRCDSLGEARRGIPDGAFRILLAHSPEIIPEAAARGVALYLCGHTHGGQLVLPWLGSPFINARCPRAYAAGIWRRGDMQGYTSTGLGTSAVPVRFNCPPEATLIELRRAGPSVV